MLLLAGGSALAQERGFTAQRLDASAAGSRTFLIERPWYSSTRYFAGGVTADYAHRVLVPTVATGRGDPQPIVDTSIVANVELAFAFLDRVRISASLPITFLERGTPEIVSGASPNSAIGIGDPRVALMLRVFGDAEADAISLHVGLDAWIPTGGAARHLGDNGPRFMPRLMLSGAAGVARYTLDGAFLYRPQASIGPPALGMTAGPEVRVGLAVGASLLNDTIYLGPEARFSSTVAGPSAMSLELLGGASFLIADTILIGAAGGTGFFGAAGTPDARAMLRIAFAPRRKLIQVPDDERGPWPDDVDHDRVEDGPDRCPFEPENENGVRDSDGCPEYEGDAGVQLAKVLTREKPRAPDAGTAVAAVDAGPNLFFTTDSDGDHVPDESDRCPLTKEDEDGFEDDDGCPELDNDADGIADATDRCALEAETVNGFEDTDGCPDVAPDVDADGVSDLFDRCPFEPETVNGLRDEDGCPEFQPEAQVATVARLLSIAAQKIEEPRDSDGDKIDDAADRCPVTAEDPDGFEDEDGCPELDDDADGIADKVDQCPLAAETFNGWKDDDGCPDEHGDVDGDGVEYVLDRCPLEPGDKTDGCPHLPRPPLALAGFSPQAPTMRDPPPPEAQTADFDKDKIPDDADRCPMTREDPDGFEDDDGCPEPDNDGDGVDDAKDRCQFEAETVNGNKDDDGCPDPGIVVVHVQKTAVVLDETVQFKTGSATLTPASLKLLKQVAAVLKGARTLSIEVQGHTDDVGNAAANIRLSQQRADAIRSNLVKAGISQRRLRAKGYGPTRPRATNTTAAGREQNRRVDFTIIGETK